MDFDATVEQAGKTATGIAVPPEIVDALGAGRKPAVKVTIGDHTYRTTVAARGERFMVSLSAENRERAGVGGGDAVRVGIELDTAPREIEVPPDLAEALAADEQAAAFFRGLSFSQQRWYVDPIGQAKKPETRQRRVEKAVSMLREGRTP